MTDAKAAEIMFTDFCFLSNPNEISCLTKALRYLPLDILEWASDQVVFFSTFGKRYGSRLSRGMCKTKEVIYISEKSFPLKFNEDKPATRFFIFIVLHETAHAYLMHKCQIYDKISEHEAELQEQEAIGLAIKWYNLQIKDRGYPELNHDEINDYKLKMNHIVDEWNKLWATHLQQNDSTLVV